MTHTTTTTDRDPFPHGDGTRITIIRDTFSGYRIESDPYHQTIEILMDGHGGPDLAREILGEIHPTLIRDYWDRGLWTTHDTNPNGYGLLLTPDDSSDTLLHDEIRDTILGLLDPNTRTTTEDDNR